MHLPLPENAVQFDHWYGDDDLCLQTLFSARGPDGFVCPRCGHNKSWDHKRRPLLECTKCGHQTSLLAGTLFHGTKLPLHKLFKLVYLLVAEKSGTNVCALSRQTGVCYDTALLWVRKIRAAMVDRHREKLKGTVEADEAQLGGPAEKCTGRRLGKNQAMLLVLVEDNGGACGRIRLEVTRGCAIDDLTPLVQKNVEAKSRVRTDGGSGYNDLEAKGFAHDVRINPKHGESKEGYLQLVHRVISLLKRFIGGVLHGSWSHQWLPHLLEEFTFRFNRRNATHRPLLFNRVLELGVGTRSTTREFQQTYSRHFRELALT
jgi:transposase-like protein